MKSYKIRITITILLLIGFYLDAQVIATGDTTLCEGQEGNVAVTLTATSYAVDLTDSNIYTDDIFGGVIDMGFDFDFYGNTYNQVVLSSNNYLSFNIANAGGYSDWTIGAAIPTTTEPETQNGILCPWQDIYPGVNGNGIIAYATTGEAPNRVFIVSFCGIPMFSCTDICYSSQIKLFETTNIIETHIAQKVLCTTWNGGAAIHGLHNADGTIAHVVTGLDGIIRNYPNAWTCENDAWQFIPNGDDDYIIGNIEFAPAVAGTDIIWQDEFGNEIGTGSEITIFPAGDVTYTAGASLCGDAGDWCGFEGGIEGDNVNITFEALSFTGIETDITCYDGYDGTIEIFPPNEGDWTYSLYENNNLISSETSSNSSYLFQNLPEGVYSATISTTDCVSDEEIFELNQPDEIVATTITNDALCNDGNDGSIEITITGGTPGYTTFASSLDGSNDLGSQVGASIVFNNLGSDEYYFSTIDGNGCLIQGDEVFFTINDPDEGILIESETGDVTCPNSEDGFINVTISGGTPPYTYEWYNDDIFYSDNEDLENLIGGTYSLSITDANDCFNETDIYISENEEIMIDASWNECITENGEITAITNGGLSPYSYELLNLTTGAITTTNNDGVFTNLMEGDYAVIVTDNVGCVKEITVTLNAAPIADFYINEYEFYLSNDPTEFLDLSTDNNIMDWSWDFGDNNTSTLQNPNNLYMDPGNYYITLNVIDSMGCESSTTQEITVLQDYYSYTPNIFTPNNDGVNDTFSPSLFNIDTNTYNLVIFDRWGNKIFETTNYNEGWNGKLKNGSITHPDLYSYKITYNTNRGIQKEEKGRVLMVR
jgi:gliding motility-associated-like protein